MPMLVSLRRAVIQLLTDPKLWWLVICSLVASLLVFLGLWGALGGLLYWLAQHVERFRQWLEWGGWIVSFVAALLLFPTTFLLVQSFFQESVAARVERKYYSTLPPALATPLRVAIWRGLKFTLLMILLNIGAAPIFLGLTFLMGSGAVVYVVHKKYSMY